MYWHIHRCYRSVRYTTTNVLDKSDLFIYNSYTYFAGMFSIWVWSLLAHNGKFSNVMVDTFNFRFILIAFDAALRYFAHTNLCLSWLYIILFLSLHNNLIKTFIKLLSYPRSSWSYPRSSWWWQQIISFLSLFSPCGWFSKIESPSFNFIWILKLWDYIMENRPQGENRDRK